MAAAQEPHRHEDVDGVPIIKTFVDVAFGGEGKGWVDYKWPNPVSKVVGAAHGH